MTIKNRLSNRCFRTLLVLILSFSCQQTFSADADTTFIYLRDGGLDVYPSVLAKVEKQVSGACVVSWGNGTEVTYDSDDIERIDSEGPADLPRLTMFKLNNKYNDQVFTDVVGDITDNQVSLKVGCIGKWLTPSFQLSDEDATTYIGVEAQRSKVSRHRFDSALTYTVALPEMHILRRHQAIVDDDGTENSNYVYAMEPFGRDYKVKVEWLSDQATNVPVVNIDTKDGRMISSKEYFLDAEISIDGAGVYPSMEVTPVHIKGRGNTSWSTNQWDKNPYRLKFDEVVKPFGLTKGKNWVLLANKKKGSMLTNAIGMKAACLTKAAGANHIVPVELYINGQYRGSYNFTEKVGLANNSIALEDESDAVLLELDTYYDEIYKFRSNPYSLPVNIKKPDFSEGVTKLTQSDVQQDFNKMLQQLKSGEEIAEYIDVEYLARYLLVCDLIENFELMRPKSVFLYKERVKGGSKYIFGPVWDLDWAFGFELSRKYCSGNEEADFYNRVNMEGKQFARDLRYVSKKLDRAYYKVWTLFMTHSIHELLDYCDEYFKFARPSLENNHKKWNDGNNYAAVATNTRNWLKQRADYIYRNLTPYELTEEELNPETGIAEVIVENVQESDALSGLVDVYNLQGQRVKHQVSITDLRLRLKPGIYIVGGKKMIIRQ